MREGRVDVGLSLKGVFFLVLFLALSIVTTATKAIGKAVASQRAGRPLAKTAIRMDKATRNTITSLSNGCALRLGGKACALAIHCVNCGSVAVGTMRVGNRAILGFSVRPSARALNRIRIATGGGLRNRHTLRVRQRGTALTVRGLNSGRVSLGNVNGIRRKMGGVANVSVTDTKRLVIHKLNSHCDAAALGKLPVTSPGPSGGLIPLSLFPSSAMRGVAIDGICSTTTFTSCDNTRVGVDAGRGVPRSFFRLDLGANKGFGALNGSHCRVSHDNSLLGAPDMSTTTLSVPLVRFSGCIGARGVFSASFTTDGGDSLPRLNKGLNFNGGFNVDGRALDLLTSFDTDGNCRGVRSTFCGALRTANAIRSSFSCSDFTRRLGLTTLNCLNCALHQDSHVNCAFFCTHGTVSACRHHRNASTRKRRLANDGGVVRVCALRGRRLGKVRGFNRNSE